MAWSAIAGIGSGLFAIAAAGLWFWSAAIPLPPQTVALFNSRTGQVTRPPREVAMERQSRLSAYAAVCAGVAALLQVASAFSA